MAMEDAERMRLIQLGDLAMNLHAKHKASLTKSKEDPTLSQLLSLKNMSTDAQKLLILSQCLGQKDGRKYLMAAEQILAKYMNFTGITEAAFRHVAAVQTGIWRDCHSDSGRRAAFEADAIAKSAAIKARIEARNAGGHPTTVRASTDHDAWVREELMQLPPLYAARKAKQKCTFCGSKSRDDNVLLACGRCKSALYCDKDCQKLHWKKHKSACAEKTSEIIGVSDEGA
ncbi:unnamed protein product [Zymoseptoria tritici ST99CH_3D7]|uniref:MYND-type domain-containing protein n=1 Tax=Zymoseptoria tritici (strain ST99CH_3D7) TaxID=1276538 RepID=A0A1X7S0H5_ZYMT9|nr:unnamed protein product [Zymoseptoria tritici ST99CH_3D7]